MTAKVEGAFEGPCPHAFVSNLSKEFFRQEILGSWYEYLWEPDFADFIDYSCSAWHFQTTFTGPQVIYRALNHLQMSDGQESYGIVDINWH